MIRSGILLIVLGIALWALRTVMASEGIPPEDAATFQGMAMGAGALIGVGVVLAILGWTRRGR